MCVFLFCCKCEYIVWLVSVFVYVFSVFVRVCILAPMVVCCKNVLLWLFKNFGHVDCSFKYCFEFRLMFNLSALSGMICIIAIDMGILQKEK